VFNFEKESTIVCLLVLIFFEKEMHNIIPASKCVQKDRDATKTKVETNEDHEDEEEVHHKQFHMHFAPNFFSSQPQLPPLPPKHPSIQKYE